jgi:hypothetical protein
MASGRKGCVAPAGAWGFGEATHSLRWGLLSACVPPALGVPACGRRRGIGRGRRIRPMRSIKASQGGCRDLRVVKASQGGLKGGQGKLRINFFMVLPDGSLWGQIQGSATPFGVVGVWDRFRRCRAMRLSSGYYLATFSGCAEVLPPRVAVGANQWHAGGGRALSLVTRWPLLGKE